MELLYGYSAICFSKYLLDNGKIDTIEIDEQRAEIARENISKMELSEKINLMVGNALEILPTLEEKYDYVFIDAAKSKYPMFLKEAIRLVKLDGIIFADNILYKGYVLGDYNKHKQRTAVNHLREYINEIRMNDKLETKILEVGDGLGISKRIK